jgi:hypothetical protein
MADRLPFDIKEAIVQVCGKAFWLKDPLKAFMISAGVPEELYERYADESKFKIARNILSDLDRMGEEGWLIQRRIVTEFYKLRKVPDENVQSKDAALSALRSLKELALTQKIIVESDSNDREQKAKEARRKQEAIAARANRMEELRNEYNALVLSKDDPQARGYCLEEIIAELFEVHEITFRKPYKIRSEQIDGHFNFRGFDYLVEARWRKEFPTKVQVGRNPCGFDNIYYLSKAQLTVYYNIIKFII